MLKIEEMVGNAYFMCLGDIMTNNNHYSVVPNRPGGMLVYFIVPLPHSPFT